MENLLLVAAGCIATVVFGILARKAGGLGRAALTALCAISLLGTVAMIWPPHGL